MMIIFFNKDFYSLEAIKSSVKAYQGFAVFEVEDEEKVVEVKMDNIKKDVREIIMDEFCNYVLSETGVNK